MDRLAWERWSRGMGVVFVVLAIVAFAIFGEQPKAEDTAADVVSFYRDDGGRVLTAVTIFGFASLALFWFVGAVVDTLRRAGEGRLGAAALALTAVWFAMQFSTLALTGALAVTIADTADVGATRALNTVALAADNVGAFPLAGAFFAVSVGLARARILPAWYTWFGLAAAVLVVLHGTNWASSGFWSPGGGYLYITVITALLWTLVTSVLLFRAPVAEEVPARAAMAAP
jgi:hypothetical protein